MQDYVKVDHVRHAGSLIQSAKASFILSPTLRTAPQAHNWRIACAHPEMPQYAALNPGISALTASHALALSLKDGINDFDQFD